MVVGVRHNVEFRPTHAASSPGVRLSAMLCLDDSAKKAAFVAAQWKQAKGQQPDVTCGCGLKLPLRFAYRCLYCGQWYCLSCAEQHFGKTREQYNAEKVGAGDTPETRGPWTGGYHWDERHNDKAQGAGGGIIAGGSPGAPG